MVITERRVVNQSTTSNRPVTSVSLMPPTFLRLQLLVNPPLQPITITAVMLSSRWPTTFLLCRLKMRPTEIIISNGQLKMVNFDSWWISFHMNCSPFFFFFFSSLTIEVNVFFFFKLKVILLWRISTITYHTSHGAFFLFNFFSRLKFVSC